jgi:hypothetical protein
MNKDRILSLICSVLISPHALESFDTIAFFDKFKHSIHVVSVDDYLNGHCDNYATIKRVDRFIRIRLEVQPRKPHMCFLLYISKGAHQDRPAR